MPAHLALQTLPPLIARVEADAFRLVVPHPRDEMRQVRGMHFHPTPELFVQVGGVTRMHLPSETVRIGPGDICIVPSGVPHGETALDGEEPFLNLVVGFGEGFVTCHNADRNEQGHPRARAWMRIEGVSPVRLRAYLDDLVHVFHAKAPRRQVVLRGLLQAVLATLSDHVAEGAPALPRTEENEKVAMCRMAVLYHLTDPSLSVHMLADTVHLTPDYLSHLFHRETGQTLTAFINRERIANARKLLESREGAPLNISEVSWACGYADPGYFARVFRREAGQSPREYRRKSS